MSAASATAKLRLLLCSLCLAPLLSACFFRVPTGTKSWNTVMGVRIDEATTNVVQTFMRKTIAVKEFAAMDPDGGGNYLRPGKDTYYIQNADNSRIKLKTLESFTYDPSLAAQFFLPPGLIATNTLASMAVPGKSGGLLMWRITNAEGNYLSNAWAVAINFSSYQCTDAPPHLKLYVLDTKHNIVRARQLPLAPPETATTVYPDLRLDSTRQYLSYKAPRGYMTYGTVTDLLVPASQPLAERILPSNTSP